MKQLLLASALLAGLVAFPEGNVCIEVTEGLGGSGALWTPTGAGEFEIEGPRVHGGPVLKAADFGFSITNDHNAAAIQRALAEAKRLKASRLELAPGTYNCFDEPGFRAEGFEDFTLDGKGALLVFRRDRRVGGANVTLVKNTRCVFGDFKMDWDWAYDPLACVGTCTNKFVDEQSDEGSYFDMKLDRAHPCYPALPPVLTATTIDAERRHLIGTPPNRLIFLGMPDGAKIAWLAPDLMRIWPGVRREGVAAGPSDFDAFRSPNRDTVRRVPLGISYRLLHAYYDDGAVAMRDNVHLTFRNVDVYGCRGSGLGVDGRQHHWQVENVRIAPPDDRLAERMTACTADGHHIRRSLGWAKYVNFTISFCNDDAHNFHDCTIYGVAEAPNRLKVTSPVGMGYFQASVGDTIELRESNFEAIGWQGRVVSVNGETMTMDRPVPQPRKGDRFLFFDRSVATDHVLMKGCVCRDAHFRNLFQTNDLTLEDCIFERMGSYAIEFCGAWTERLWCEGMGVTNCVVRNCLFREGNQMGRGQGGCAAEILSNLYPPNGFKVAPFVPGFFDGILVDGCRFENLGGVLADIRYGKNVIFCRNVIVDDGKLAKRHPDTGSLVFHNCDGVTVRDNVWKFAKDLRLPCLKVLDGSKNVLCGENRVLREEVPAPRQDWEQAILEGRADRDRAIYSPGEEMVFTIKPKGIPGPVHEGKFFIDWTRTGDDGIAESGRVPYNYSEPLVIRTRMVKPGFVRIVANVVDADGKTVPKKSQRWENRVFFEGGACVEPEKLRSLPPPSDLDAYWQKVRTEIDAVPVRELERVEMPSKDSDVKVYAVRVTSAGPRPVTGYLTLPAGALKGGKYPAELVFQGATHDPQAAPTGGPHDRICFRPNSHGYELGRDKAYYEAFFKSIEPHGALYGMDPVENRNRETSYLKQMAMRGIRAAQYLMSLDCWDGKALTVGGGSMGSYQGLIVAANVPEVTAADADGCWGLDWGGRTQGRIKSWYSPSDYHPETAYFDPCHLAPKIRCKVSIWSGLGDYVSPPSGLTVLYNQLAGPRTIRYVQGCTHGYRPDGQPSFTLKAGEAESCK